MFAGGIAGRARRPKSALAVGIAAVGMLVLLQHVSAGTGGAPAGPGRASAAPARARAVPAFGNLPLAFVANAGQADAGVRYQAQAGGASFSFTATGAVFAFARGEQRAALELSFVGANRSPLIVGADMLPGKLNYLTGNDPTRWRSGLPTYREVVYRELWPGIDLAFRGDADVLKYEFRLAPGAKVSDIRLRYLGAERVSLTPAGELRIDTPLGVLRDSRPVTYQIVDGRRSPVESAYALTGSRHGYGFAAGAYDRTGALVIDPGLAYSTFLGGPFVDTGRAIAVDAAGHAYVTGLLGSTDAFVTRLDAAGAVVYTTILGGSAADDGLGIAVDADGNAVATGWTMSANFPTTAGAFDSTFNGGPGPDAVDAFVTKLNPAGAIVYSTYLGGEFRDEGRAIAVDAAGNAYVTGATRSFGFPATPGAFDTSYGGCCPGFAGNTDIFVTTLDPAGAMIYSTFLGSNNGDDAFGIAVDGAGSAYVAGTVAVGFPTTPGAYDTTHNGSSDVSVTKLNPEGSALVYSTFIGGSSNENARGIAVDGDGNAYVTGQTTSANFPLANAFDTNLGGFLEGFATMLDAAGSGLVYSTYLGGSNATAGWTEEGLGIAVDGAGNAYVTGITSSPDFPTTPGALDTTKNNFAHDAFVTKLSPTGSLSYSTFLGATLFRGNGIAVDGNGNAFAAGERDNNGTVDIFVVKLAVAAAPAELTLSPPSAVNAVGEEHCVTATARDQFGNPVPSASIVFSAAGANAAAGVAVTDASGQAAFCYTGTLAGEDAITAFADSDGDGIQDVTEPSASAGKTYVAAAPATLTLTPATDANPVGTVHSVTAAAFDAYGNPVGEILVRFSITGSISASGNCTTDASGACDFAYQGPDFPGADLIAAFADTNGDGVHDAEEPAGDASKSWVLPISTPGQASGGGNFQMGADRIAFGFSARHGAEGVQGSCNVIDRAAGMVVKCTDVIGFFISDNAVTVYGNAVVNGIPTAYRIDAADNARRGRGADTFSIVTASGYIRLGTLVGGNVRVD